MNQPSEARDVRVRAQRLGRAIRRHRGRMTQAELADRLGVSQSAVSQWETGTTEVTAEHMIRLEGVLGLRSGSLFVEAGYVDESLLGLDAAMRLALGLLEEAVARLSRLDGPAGIQSSDGESPDTGPGPR